MHGSLDPEENVMEDRVMYPGGMLGQLCPATLDGWDYGDDVAVEIGGTSVYEIDGGRKPSKRQLKEPVNIMRMRSLLSKIGVATPLFHLNQTQI